jgi:phosphoribosylformylglycinamidine cyclo-ligase
VIYTPAVLAVLDAGVDVHAVAHITGGGLPGNLPRVLAPGVDAVLDASTWKEPPIFGEIRRLGGISEDEMQRVFNLGVGMVLAVSPGSEASCMAALGRAGQDSAVVGGLTPGDRQVRIVAEAESG